MSAFVSRCPRSDASSPWLDGSATIPSSELRGGHAAAGFLGVVGGLAVWALAAQAQQPAMRRIAVLMFLAEDDTESNPRIAAFIQGLQKLNWAADHNVHI